MSEPSLPLEGALVWLDRAVEDLRAARHSRAGEFYRNALFLCQQCAEKAIKGYLTFRQTPFPKTHSITALADLVEPLDADLAAIVETAQGITKYAVIMRYPGAPYEPDANETEVAIEIAESVLAAVMGRLR